MQKKKLRKVGEFLGSNQNPSISPSTNTPIIDKQTDQIDIHIHIIPRANLYKRTSNQRNPQIFNLKKMAFYRDSNCQQPSVELLRALELILSSTSTVGKPFSGLFSNIKLTISVHLAIETSCLRSKIGAFVGEERRGRGR